jgi:chromosome segregation ATPase
MIYLITQVLALLAIASILSGIFGWLLRRFKAAKAESMLRQRLRRSEQSIPPIKDALAQAHDDLDRQDADIAALRRELAERDQSAADAERRQRELEQQIKDSLAASARAQADKDGLLKDINALRLADNSAQGSMAEKDAQIADASQRLDGLNRELAAQQAERARLEQQGANAEADIAALRREIADLQKALADAQADAAQKINSLETKAAELNDAREKQKFAAMEANTARADNERKYGDLKRDFDALRKTDSDTRQKLADAERANAAATDRANDVQRQLADLEKAMAREGEAQDEARAQLEKEIAGLQAELNQKSEQLADATSKGADLGEQLADYQSLEAELRARISKLEMLLSEERRMAGQSLLARIVELESMLEAERQKAEELPEIPEVSDVKVRAQINRSSAVNAARLKKSG